MEKKEILYSTVDCQPINPEGMMELEKPTYSHYRDNYLAKNPQRMLNMVGENLMAKRNINIGFFFLIERGRA